MRAWRGGGAGRERGVCTAGGPPTARPAPRLGRRLRSRPRYRLRARGMGRRASSGTPARPPASQHPCNLPEHACTCATASPVVCAKVSGKSYSATWPRCVLLGSSSTSGDCPAPGSRRGGVSDPAACCAAQVRSIELRLTSKEDVLGEGIARSRRVAVAHGSTPVTCTQCVQCARHGTACTAAAQPIHHSEGITHARVGPHTVFVSLIAVVVQSQGMPGLVQRSPPKVAPRRVPRLEPRCPSGSAPRATVLSQRQDVEDGVRICRPAAVEGKGGRGQVLRCGARHGTRWHGVWQATALCGGTSSAPTSLGPGHRGRRSRGRSMGHRTCGRAPA